MNSQFEMPVYVRTMLIALRHAMLILCAAIEQVCNLHSKSSQ